MQINKEGLNLVSILAVSSIVSALVIFPLLPFFFILLILAIWLNRDPDRVTAADSRAVTSPVDGYIASIDEVEEKDFFNTRVKRVSIYRKPFDINVNRAPVDGKVEYQRFSTGNSFSDFDTEDSVQTCDEKACSLRSVYFKSTLGINGESHKVMVAQKGLTICGFALPWTSLGDQIRQGGRTGLSGLFAKTELLFPDNCCICVTKGQHVRGGIDIIACSRE
jgi:phosphatidylserine decarboxylase